MIRQAFGLLLITGVVIATGCNSQRPFNALNMGSARIAPPSTGSLNQSRMAQLPNTYYNPGPGSVLQPPNANSANPGNQAANAQNGWHKANQNHSPNMTSANFNSLQPTAANGIPSNNISVASTTSTLGSPGSGQTTTANRATGSGGMRLNDATRVAAAPGNNRLSGSFEYIARPGVPGYVQPNLAAQPVVNSGNAVLATSTTANQFSGPRFYQQPGYGSGNWRPRTPAP